MPVIPVVDPKYLLRVCNGGKTLLLREFDQDQENELIAVYYGQKAAHVDNVVKIFALSPVEISSKVKSMVESHRNLD